MTASNLVQVHTSSDKGSADLIKGYLKKNGIMALIKVDSGPGEAIFGNLGSHSPLNAWEVYVREDRAEQARELLRKFNESGEK